MKARKNEGQKKIKASKNEGQKGRRPEGKKAYRIKVKRSEGQQ